MGNILHPRIRAFEAADLPAIQRIEDASFGRDAFPREVFLNCAAAVPQFFLVALVSGRPAGYSIVGYIIATLTYHGAEIESLAALPRYRRYGVATALMRAAIGKLRRVGVRKIFLMARRNNLPAVHLYRGLGFVRVATVAGYYPNGVIGWRMRLLLSTVPPRAGEPARSRAATARSATGR